MVYLEMLYSESQRSQLLEYRLKTAFCTRDTLEHIQSGVFSSRFDDTVARIDFPGAHLEVEHKYRINGQVRELLEQPLEFRQYPAHHAIGPSTCGVRGKGFHALLF
jgi:hypothetical protein